MSTAKEFKDIGNAFLQGGKRKSQYLSFFEAKYHQHHSFYVSFHFKP
jgi:hypothetical protein